MGKDIVSLASSQLENIVFIPRNANLVADRVAKCTRLGICPTNQYVSQPADVLNIYDKVKHNPRLFD